MLPDTRLAHRYMGQNDQRGPLSVDSLNKAQSFDATYTVTAVIAPYLPYDGTLCDEQQRPGGEHDDVGHAREMGRYRDQRIDELQARQDGQRRAYREAAPEQHVVEVIAPR